MDIITEILWNPKSQRVNFNLPKKYNEDNFFFLISKKDVNSRSYLMKKHKATKSTDRNKQTEKANYKGEN